jgi:hypothetical protein
VKPEKVPVELIRYPTELYLSIDFGEGEDCEHGCRKQFVRVQKPRQCFAGQQEHVVGTIMVKETAIVDDEPQTCYCCLACAARYIDFSGGVEDEDGAVVNPHNHHCDGSKRSPFRSLP